MVGGSPRRRLQARLEFPVAVVIIEQIGSYAGLAAILGLAVLAALFFSQARDLRRLREEAEERPAAAPTGSTVRPVPRQAPDKPAAEEPAAPAPKTPAPKTPAPRPAGAQAPGQPKPAGAGAAPAAAASTGAAPAAASAAAPSAPAPSAPVGGGHSTPGQAAPDAGKQGAVAANAGPAPPAKPPPPKPTAQPRPGPPPPTQQQPAKAMPPRAATVGGTPAPGQPRTLRASTGTAGRPSWYQRLAPRYLALAIVGVLILGLGVAYGVVSLVGDDPPAPVATEGDRGGRGENRADSGGAPVDPSDVVVSILNGTNVPGLAAEIGDTIEAAGFERGNVANASNQESAESVVLYVDGEADAAREVGRELDISQIQPIDAENESLAGDATVVVIVGADQAQ